MVEKGYKKISPFFIPYAITNMGGALLAIDTGFMGPNYSISTACATANYAFVAGVARARGARPADLGCRVWDSAGRGRPRRARLGVVTAGGVHLLSAQRAFAVQPSARGGGALRTLGAVGGPIFTRPL